MTRNGRLLLPFVAAAALAACDGGDGLASDQARVSIRLTDAPGDLAEAWVQVDRIYLQAHEGQDGGGRVDLLTTQTEWIDLMTLSGGRTAELVNGTVVPAGSYSELRFVVCEAYVVTADGDVYASRDAALPAGVQADGELHMPSACQSGFKVKFPSDAPVDLENESTILTVDFDVSQSFGHQAGNSGRWVMHPVMHATAVSFAGGIGGTVSAAQGVAWPACGGAATDVTVFVPQASANGSTHTSIVESDGRYRITVSPGTYTMSHASAIGFTNGDTLTVTATPSAASATVASGQVATVDYSVTAANCKAKPAG